MILRESERIYIRPILATDANFIFAYRSLPSVAKYQYWEPFTMQQALEYAEECSHNDVEAKGVWVGLAVVLKSNDDLIGDCAFIINGSEAEIGCNISTDYQHQGYGQEAMKLLMNYCFEDPQVEEITGIVDSKNVASIKMLEAIGMKKDPSFENRMQCKGVLSIENKYVINRLEIKSRLITS